MVLDFGFQFINSFDSRTWTQCSRAGSSRGQLAPLIGTQWSAESFTPSGVAIPIPSTFPPRCLGVSKISKYPAGIDVLLLLMLSILFHYLGR